MHQGRCQCHFDVANAISATSRCSWQLLGTPWAPVGYQQAPLHASQCHPGRCRCPVLVTSCRHRTNAPYGCRIPEPYSTAATPFVTKRWTTEVQVPLRSIGVTTTHVLTCPSIMSSHYRDAGMMLHGCGSSPRVRSKFFIDQTTPWAVSKEASPLSSRASHSHPDASTQQNGNRSFYTVYCTMYSG